MHLQPLVILVKELLMSFMPSFEVFKVGFHDRVERVCPVHGAHVLRSMSDFSTCLLDIVGSSVDNDDYRFCLLH